MTVLKFVALVGFVLGAAGIPLVILAMDLIRPWGRPAPAGGQPANAATTAPPAPDARTSPAAASPAPPGAAEPGPAAHDQKAAPAPKTPPA